MNAEQGFSGSMDGGDAVVTYSRVPSRRRRVSAPARNEPRQAPVDATDMSFAPGDLRAERPNVVYDGGRPGYLRYGLVGATLALLAGAGVLAISVGTATIVPREYAASEPARAVALTAGQPRDDAGAPSASVREIPLHSDSPVPAVASVEQNAVEVAPPLPRPRPDNIASGGEQTAAAADVPVLPPPDRSGEAATAPVATSAPPVPEVSETDGLIASIEETLARIDSGETADAVVSGSPAANLDSIAPAAPSRAEPPPVVMQPSQPAAGPGRRLSDGAGSYPGDIIPPNDIMPPTVAGDMTVGAPIPPEPLPPAPVVDGAYPSVPIPPEAVPQAYPGGDYIYYGPAHPYDVDLPEAEVQRPGLLRRSFAKASTAVGRVFWWN